MTLKDKPSDIFGIILLTPEELETGAGACTETVEIGYFMRFFNFCAFYFIYGEEWELFQGIAGFFSRFLGFHIHMLRANAILTRNRRSSHISDEIIEPRLGIYYRNQ